MQLDPREIGPVVGPRAVAEGRLSEAGRFGRTGDPEKIRGDHRRRLGFSHARKRLLPGSRCITGGQCHIFDMAEPGNHLGGDVEIYLHRQGTTLPAYVFTAVPEVEQGVTPIKANKSWKENLDCVGIVER